MSKPIPILPSQVHVFGHLSPGPSTSGADGTVEGGCRTSRIRDLRKTAREEFPRLTGGLNCNLKSLLPGCPLRCEKALSYSCPQGVAHLHTCLPGDCILSKGSRNRPSLPQVVSCQVLGQSEGTITSIIKIGSMGGETAPQLRTHTALAEVQSSVPRSDSSQPLWFKFQGIPCSILTSIDSAHTCTDAHIHINKNK